jgi:DNA primase
MTSKLSDSELEKIREVPITSLLGMEKAYRRISIRCPFHNEKSPSLVIYPDNSFHCFGCRAHGHNALDFAMKLGYSFVEAVNELKKYI